MTSLWQDLVHGFLMLLKKPGLTAVAALSLALGIGANTVIFSLINGTLLRPLAFADPDRLVVVWKTPAGHPDQRNNVNVSSYFAVRNRSSSFESVGAFNGALANIGAEQDGAPAERINGEAFTPSMFKVIGAKLRPLLAGPLQSRPQRGGQNADHGQTAEHRHRRDARGLHLF